MKTSINKKYIELEVFCLLRHFSIHSPVLRTNQSRFLLKRLFLPYLTFISGGASEHIGYLTNINGLE